MLISAQPNNAIVAGSGTAVSASRELTVPCTETCPLLSPFGAGTPVNTVVVNTVNPKFPVTALTAPGPSVNGAQLIVSGLTSLNTVPPADVPMKIPLAPSVTSVTTSSNVNALNTAPAAKACVEHALQSNWNVPRLMLDGTPVAISGTGENVSVAAAPNELLCANPFPVNFVPAELVLKVMVAALAALTRSVDAIPKRESERVIVFIFTSVFSCA